MNDVEITEDWLFERLRLDQERELREPEDAYLEVQRLEPERAEKGLSPRIQFLEGPRSDDQPEMDQAIN